MNFFELKNIILKELSQYISGEQNLQLAAVIIESEQFISFSYTFNDLSLQSLCHFSSAAPLCYLSSKNAEREDLALGSCRKFRNNEERINLKKLLEHSHLTFFGGQKFDPKQKSALEWHAYGEQFYFLPRIWLSNTKTEQSQMTIYIDKVEFRNKKIDKHLIFAIEQLLDFNLTNSRISSTDRKEIFLYDHQIPDINKWEQNISQCLQRLNLDLEKVVMSRKQVYKATFSDVLSTFLKRHKQNENHYVYLLKLDENHLFVSLTPEKLFKIENNILTSDAIAGTRSRGKTESEDLLLESELLSSDKELREHRIVSFQISKAFEKTCHDFCRLSKEAVLKLNNVQHLISSFQGVLKGERNHLDLIELFHPTPAVGGHPSKPALELLRKIEGYDRGFYSAPVGIISKNYTEFIVAIRSALLYKENLHVYGGAGIVSGSNAKDEWSETQKKMNTIREYIL
jgi:menaquinone-specific isochorismate synthase